MTTIDPAMRALLDSLTHQDEVIKRNEGYVQEAAAQLVDCNNRKKRAQEVRKVLVEHLNESFPGWEAIYADGDFALEA